MKYRPIGHDPTTRREVSVLSLGAMLFGTATDEATSLAILDRYVEAGGTFVDTSTTTPSGSTALRAARARRSSAAGTAAGASATRS